MASPLGKLNEALSIVMNFQFEDDPRKLVQATDMIDILGAMVDENSKVYKKISSANKILREMISTGSRAPSKIDKACKYLTDAQTLLIYGE